jgi:glutamate dehydrogenase (NADP+)
MSQNAGHGYWSAEEVDAKLRSIMKGIHKTCVASGKKADGFIDYVAGANIAGFKTVAEGMIAQGI